MRRGEVMSEAREGGDGADGEGFMLQLSYSQHRYHRYSSSGVTTLKVI